MQKVEGSNPFSRFPVVPCKQAGFHDEGRPWAPLLVAQREIYRTALFLSNLTIHSSAWSHSATLVRVEVTTATFDAAPSLKFINQALLFMLWSGQSGKAHAFGRD